MIRRPDYGDVGPICRICHQEAADHDWCEECEAWICPASPWSSGGHGLGCPEDPAQRPPEDDDDEAYRWTPSDHPDDPF